MPSFGDIVHFLSDVMELDGTRHYNVSFQYYDLLLKIIIAPCSEQYHVGIIPCLPNYTR